MLHSVQSFFYFSPKCLFSVRLDSLCLPRGRGRGLVCTRRFSFREFYNLLLFYFLIVIFLENCFFSHDIYPLPRPTTHDSGLHPVQINPVEQVLIKPSLAIPDQPSPTSPDQPSLASPDQTQSRRSSSNPVEPVQINPV